MSAHEAVDRAFDGGAFPGPGMIVGVVTPHGLEAWRAEGRASLDGARALDPQTAFYLASVSKQFTALCVHLVAGDGGLAFADPVARHVPELSGWADGVTIGHLLYHSSGLADYVDVMAASGRALETESVSDDEIVDALARHRTLAFEPGSQVVYSNTGYWLLCVVVRRTTRLSLRAFAQDRVFGPLGMANTWYRDDHRETVATLADGHTERSDGSFVRVESVFDRVGDGGMISTLADLAIWESSVLSGSQPWRELADRLAEPYPIADGSVSSWRAGVVVEEVRGEPAILAGGTALGYRGFIVRLPRSGRSVICLSNLESMEVRPAGLRVVEAL